MSLLINKWRGYVSEKFEYEVLSLKKLFQFKLIEEERY